MDLRDHPLPFFEGISPIRRGRDYPNDEVARFGETIDRADGFVVLTAEYNHGYPAVLKNAMDWTFPEWNRKPISFVGWGNVGGARAVEQLRKVAVEFEMAPLRHAVHILPDVMIPILREGPTPRPRSHRWRRASSCSPTTSSWWTAALAARARPHASDAHLTSRPAPLRAVRDCADAGAAHAGAPTRHAGRSPPATCCSPTAQDVDALYVLLDGSLRIDKAGTTVATVTERGACVGEMSLLLGVPATADVIATAPSVVAVLDDAARAARHRARRSRSPSPGCSPAGCR